MEGSPEDARAGLNVVLLCGGFNERIVEDVRNQGRQAEGAFGFSSIRRKTRGGVEHIPSGLFSVGERHHMLAHTIKYLLDVHQAQPLQDSLYMVTNRANHDEYTGSGGFFQDVGRFPPGWHEWHVVCNNAARPEEWRGHVADVQMALQRVDASRPTVVLDARLFFFPLFPLQKAFSNMLVRDAPTVAVKQMDRIHCCLFPEAVPTLSLESSLQVPRAQVQPAAAATPGAWLPLPLLLLPTRCAAAARASTASTLLQLVQGLEGAMYAARTPGGAVVTDTFLGIRYVQSHMTFRKHRAKALTRLACLKQGASDAVSPLFMEDIGEGLGGSDIYARRHISRVEEVFEEERKALDQFMFSEHGNKVNGFQLQTYNLPPTFYMSTYRKHAAAIL